ncbi:MAG: hypothetical protein ABSF53_08080, partial [Terracidiphilus sp.]
MPKKEDIPGYRFKFDPASRSRVPGGASYYERVEQTEIDDQAEIDTAISLPRLTPQEKLRESLTRQIETGSSRKHFSVKETAIIFLCDERTIRNWCE